VSSRNLERNHMSLSSKGRIGERCKLLEKAFGSWRVAEPKQMFGELLGGESMSEICCPATELVLKG